MAINISRWIHLSVISFLAVAVLGVLMRYKIPFSLPALNQKHLLHAHSHFAFTGWVTQTIYALMIGFLQQQRGTPKISRYNFILAANLIVSYGMLFTFAAQGYATASIILSTASIIINYIFCFWYALDLRRIPAHPSTKWFKAALFFSVLSSLGTFYLAYMMYSKSVDQNRYLGSLYFFLHFQYNGWFTFASFGVLIAWLQKQLHQIKAGKTVFHLFFWACIPAYFLSTLWANLPLWLYIVVVLAAISQFGGWVLFIAQTGKVWNKFKGGILTTGRVILLLVALAFTIKLVLQLGSTIPAVSKLAFGFRPIVIAYLHLILLAVFSLFLLSYSYINSYLVNNKITVYGLITIATGIFLNEFVLLIQGVAAFSYTAVPYVNEVLLAVAVFILSGIIVLLFSQLGRSSARNF